MSIHGPGRIPEQPATRRQIIEWLEAAAGITLIEAGRTGGTGGTDQAIRELAARGKANGAHTLEALDDKIAGRTSTNLPAGELEHRRRYVVGIVADIDQALEQLGVTP